MATHSSVLAWRIPWTEELGGLQFIASERVEHYWSDLARMHALSLIADGIFEEHKFIGSVLWWIARKAFTLA